MRFLYVLAFLDLIRALLRTATMRHDALADPSRRAEAAAKPKPHGRHLVVGEASAVVEHGRLAADVALAILPVEQVS